MDSENWLKVEEIFNQVIELAPKERKGVLAKVCNGDTKLRHEVETLIKAEEENHGQLAKAVESAAKNFFGGADSTPKQIGKYRILREIGRGGMGAVFLASREDEIKKRVAVKVIKRGMDTDDILRRFRNERQILAALDHQNIARLLDGGTTNEGLPYFVMEYVEGKPLLEYCERNKLSTMERLKLFRQICAAVAFAHQNLVVHRDLKPSNIIVTSDGTAKLLDFGIAKMLNPEISGQTLNPTATAVRLMTPEYASPEQVRGDAITTASDVYSLGVLLYELLTGHRPYQIKKHTSVEIIHSVCDSEPLPPSNMATLERQTANGKHTTADGEHKTNRHLSSFNPKSLRGDIDNIILMALRKEPSRRYSSVEQFSEDIRRHQDGLPVTARRLTLVYRIGKFTKRHQIPVALASFVVMLLIGFGVTQAIQSNRIARERDQANIERERAEKVSNFLTEIFRSANPNASPGKELTARELLDKGAEKVRNELKDQPEVQTKLLLTMAKSYQALSVYEKAEELGDEALRLHQQIYGERHAETLAAMDFLADVKYWRNKLPEALTMLRQVVAIRRETNGESFETAKSLSQMALWTRMTFGNSTDEAETLYREALAMARKTVPSDDQRKQEILTDFAVFLFEFQYGTPEAETLCREAVRLAEPHAAEKPLELASAYGCLGRSQVMVNKLDEAESNLRRTLEIRRQFYKVENQSVSNALNSLGELYVKKKEYDKAEPLLMKSLEIRKKIDSRVIAYTYNTLAQMRQEQGRFTEAEAFFKEALSSAKSPDARILYYYGGLLMKSGKPEQAEKILREALEMAATNYGKSSPYYAECLSLLGESLTKQKRPTEAAPLLQEGYETALKAVGENHPITREARERILNNQF